LDTADHQLTSTDSPVTRIAKWHQSQNILGEYARDVGLLLENCGELEDVYALQNLWLVPDDRHGEALQLYIRSEFKNVSRAIKNLLQRIEVSRKRLENVIATVSMSIGCHLTGKTEIASNFTS
jgi:hypothetical protein